jgi:tetraacyldisaccharide 4'-kinase
MMKFIRRILSWIYTLVVVTRHRLYDWGVLKSFSFDIPIVCIGNITVGGTGKTPTAEYILSSLANHYTMAILSRGYGRTTKGYREVSVNDIYTDVGDEPLQIKLKFPGAVVVVCEDRVLGIERLRQEHPEVNLIIMDDGFQHRRVRPKVNILIMDSTRPFENDNMLPLGRLRDVPSRLKEGHIFIVSKCDDAMSPIDKRLWLKKLRHVAYQKVFFSKIEPLGIEPVYNFSDREEPYYAQQAILVSGIGNPRPFIREAETRFTIVDKVIFPDHHKFTTDDLKRIYAKFLEHPRAIILTTEKDAVRLRRARMPENMMRAMYYQPIAMCLVEGPERDDFVECLIADIEYKEREDKNDGDKEKSIVNELD